MLRNILAISIIVVVFSLGMIGAVAISKSEAEMKIYTDVETGCQYLTTDAGFIQLRLADNGYDVVGCKRMGDY